MLDENTKEFTVKVIDTEEDVKLGQITFNIKDLYQLENFEEPFGSFNIGNQKVIIDETVFNTHLSYSQVGVSIELTFNFQRRRL